jgi:hypothetical protein
MTTTLRRLAKVLRGRIEEPELIILPERDRTTMCAPLDVSCWRGLILGHKLDVIKMLLGKRPSRLPVMLATRRIWRTMKDPVELPGTCLLRGELVEGLGHASLHVRGDTLLNISIERLGGHLQFLYDGEFKYNHWYIINLNYLKELRKLPEHDL